jgi:hypothetical protein
LKAIFPKWFISRKHPPPVFRCGRFKDPNTLAAVATAPAQWERIVVDFLDVALG